MSLVIRLATRSDAEQWRELLRIAVGDGYPGREVYDLDWIARELAPQTDRQTWVAEYHGRLEAAVSFLKPVDTNTNPVANLGRLLLRPESYASGGARDLLRKIIELAAERGRMIVTRVPASDLAQQQLFEDLGCVCCGFQPCKHLQPTRHGVLFYVHSANAALVARLPLSESLPQISELAGFALNAFQLPPLHSVPDGATGYPLQTEIKIEELTCDDFEIWRRHSAASLLPNEISTGCNRGLGLLRLDEAAPLRALCAQRHEQMVAGLVCLYDEHDRCVRLLEAFSTDDLSLGALLQHALKLAQDKLGAAYVEVDILMTAPRLLKTAEQLGFVPVAYLPAFASERGHLTDVVKMIKLNAAYALENTALTPSAAALVKIADRYFEEQKLGVAVVNLMRGLQVFEGLGDGELRKVARLFQQKLFRAGETVLTRGGPDTEAFVVMRGQVDISLDEPARPIASITSGQIFGEQAFLEGAPRTATATATQPSILLIVQRTAFQDLVQREPHLGQVILRNIALDLSRKLRRANALLAAQQGGSGPSSSAG